MALYVLGDLHLSESVDKPMDVFGRQWHDHVNKIKDNWCLTEKDVCVLAGDSSWAINLEEAEADFKLIHSLPGKKLLLKGNHDYWWTTVRKIKNFLKEKGFNSIDLIQNNAFEVCGSIVCGTRGWITGNGTAEDEKIISREKGRLELSLSAAEKINSSVTPIVFLHYPPLFAAERCEPIMEALKNHEIKKVFYGHLHGTTAHSLAVTGVHENIEFNLISGDYVNFTPQKVTE